MAGRHLLTQNSFVSISFVRDCRWSRWHTKWHKCGTYYQNVNCMEMSQNWYNASSNVLSMNLNIIFEKIVIEVV